MRRLGFGMVLIGLAVAAFIAFRFVYGWTEAGPATKDITIVVPEGATIADAAILLKQKGAVRSADAFLTRAKVFGRGKSIKAGEFLIPQGASNSDIFRILGGGKTLTRLVTIPEGMPSILVHERLMANEELTGDISVPAEGSVLPDSYAFDKGESRAVVLKRMQDAMNRTLAKMWAERAPNTAARTPKEAIVLASIVEKETAVPAEVTIPEGMPSILVHERLMANEELTGDISVPAEGSVLPDSYAFDKGESRAAVLKRMQDAMNRTLAKMWAERAPNTVARTPKEAIVLASIVEKETAVPAERPTVAGVYGNRLKARMMLQADPTIIYPITRGKPLGRRIRKSEIAAVNDYNTYAMIGLPKGPIANPGRLSILAVLHPAETKALYFVADGKGGHIFADTLQEHNENVRKWFEIRRARGEL